MPVTVAGVSAMGSRRPIGPGSQPSSEKNTKTRIRPSQKSGIEPEIAPHLLDALLGRELAGNEISRIARQEPHQEEHDERYGDELRHEKDQTAQ